MPAFRVALASAAYAGALTVGACLITEARDPISLAAGAALAVGGVAGLIRTVLPLPA